MIQSNVSNFLISAGQYAEVAAHEPSCGNRPGAASSSEDSEDNSQDNLVECGGCNKFQPSEHFDRNALADGAMFGGLCWDCLQTKEQQVPQHEARPSDVGAGASGEDDGFVSVAGLGSLQSASVGSSDGGGVEKPRETWLQKHYPEIDGPARPPKARGPAPGRGGAPKKQRDPGDARFSEVLGAGSARASWRRTWRRPGSCW